MRQLRISDWEIRIGPTATLIAALALTVVGVPLVAGAQEGRKAPRIGVLTQGGAPDPRVEALKQGSAS